MIVRDARRDDVPAMLEIYRPFVESTAVSFELEPPSFDEFAVRVATAQTRWAWVVAEDAGALAGYAYGGAFRSRPAYRFSTEVSAYVAESRRGGGVGRLLYSTLLERLTALGYCTAFAGIVVPNDPSIALHRAAGFEPIGVFRRAGWKFGAWHDVSWWQRPLRETPVE